jgi:hypothetical protein
VARAGLSVLILLIASVALTGYVVYVEIDKERGFFVDQFFLPMICGAIVAVAVAVATSGIVLRDRTLYAVDILTVTELDASQIADVQDASGLTVVARSGRRVQPYVCGRTLAKQLNQNLRLRVGGEAIRVWQADHLDLDEDRPDAGPPPDTERRRPRWPVIVGVPAGALLCGLLTVVAHAAVH